MSAENIVAGKLGAARRYGHALPAECAEMYTDQVVKSLARIAVKAPPLSPLQRREIEYAFHAFKVLTGLQI